MIRMVSFPIPSNHLETISIQIKSAGTPKSGGLIMCEMRLVTCTTRYINALFVLRFFLGHNPL